MRTSGAPTVIVAGYLSLDHIVAPGGELTDVPGGAALYAALAAAWAGGSVSLCAKVGGDFPRAALEAMKAAGVDLSHLVHDGGSSRRAHLIEPKPGAEPRDSPSHADAGWWERTTALAPVPIGGRVDVMILTPLPPKTARLHVTEARRFGATVIADTSEAYARKDPAGVKALAGQVDLFAPSTEELAILGYGDAPGALAPAVLEKRGAHGARLWRCGRLDATVESRASRVLDTTGAGDSLIGAFGAARARKASDEEALTLGLDAAARTLSGLGPSAWGVPVPVPEDVPHAY
ncbi:MAG: carbohydrate kinase family protein [Alphaproteobacteria bacterium]|nr:carbohydrate kinase family protein [Alphaproteobacteria bacterium]